MTVTTQRPTYSPVAGWGRLPDGWGFVEATAVASFCTPASRALRASVSKASSFTAMSEFSKIEVWPTEGRLRRSKATKRRRVHNPAGRLWRMEH